MNTMTIDLARQLAADRAQRLGARWRPRAPRRGRLGSAPPRHAVSVAPPLDAA